MGSNEEDLPDLLARSRTAARAAVRRRRQRMDDIEEIRAEADRRVADIEARRILDQEEHAQEVANLKEEVANLRAEAEGMQHVHPEAIYRDAIREYKRKILVPLATKARLEGREDGVKEGIRWLSGLIQRDYPQIDLSKYNPDEDEDEESDADLGAGEGPSRDRRLQYSRPW